MDLQRARIVVEGRVQGVGFRWSACREARALGLTGWVCNRSDGCVEAEAEGASIPLAAFVAWCHSGPPAAQVTRVSVQDLPPRREKGFVIRA